MKVTQTVDIKYHHFYVGFGYAEFKDEAGNLVNIKLSDDDVLDMYDTMKYKRDRVLKQRAEEAAELESQTLENEDE